MNKTIAIQCKAAFLLFIFSLNMFVGLACSIGLTNGKDGSHHQPETVKKSAHAHSHEHGKAGKGHQHNEAKPHDHKTDHKDEKNKKGCCNDEVQKVQQLDKNINSSAKKLLVDNVVILQHLYLFVPQINSTGNPVKLRERFFYPPPPNILINIQRFQI